MYNVPSWFLGYDALAESIFALVTILLSVLAFKIYKLTKSSTSKMLGFGFLFIAFSYIILAIFNIGNCFNLHEPLCEITNWDPLAWYSFQVSLHLMLYLLGLITLVYMTFKVKSFKLYSLLILLGSIPFLFNHSFPRVYFILSSILIVYIFAFYFKNYLNNKNYHTASISIAFALLFIGDLLILFTMESDISAIIYVIWHSLKLVAYLLILSNLIPILKK
ncbi:MAG: hypothetical protein ACMXYG_02015 [Candidatus Woesearchaeota archaeon]